MDGLYIVDAQQRIILWNNGAERILGYAGEEVLNQYCYRVIQGKARSGKLLCQPGCTVNRCVKRGVLPGSVDMLVRTKAGRELWLNASVIIFTHKTNPLAVHLIRDISRQERLEQAASQIVHTLRISGVLERAKDGNNDACSCAAPYGLTLNQLFTLSRRELEVLRLLSEGLSTENISHRLNISRYTVRNHVQHVLSKLRVQNRAQAVASAFRSGLL